MGQSGLLTPLFILLHTAGNIASYDLHEYHEGLDSRAFPFFNTYVPTWNPVFRQYICLKPRSKMHSRTICWDLSEIFLTPQTSLTC